MPMAAQVQKPAPDFTATAVVNEEFKEVKLSDYKGKYVVLFFYPLDFTFVCPTEIVAFGDRIREFRDRGAEVIGCSIDSQFSHLAWIQTPREKGGLGGLSYPLVADLTKKISADYGVLLDGGIALRGTFVIDQKGIVRAITVHDLPLGRSVDEALRVLGSRHQREAEHRHDRLRRPRRCQPQGRRVREHRRPLRREQVRRREGCREVSEGPPVRRLPQALRRKGQGNRRRGGEHLRAHARLRHTRGLATRQA